MRGCRFCIAGYVFRPPRYRPLELHHLGESLLHPQVDEFVARASARGLPTELSVNPSLLTPTRALRKAKARTASPSSSSG